MFFHEMKYCVITCKTFDTKTHFPWTVPSYFLWEDDTENEMEEIFLCLGSFYYHNLCPGVFHGLFFKGLIEKSP